MPKSVKVHIKIDPMALERKPELTCQIAIIAGQWHDIEDELTWIFAYAMGTDPALATMAIGRVNSLLAKLEMIEAAIAHTVSENAAEWFRKKFHKRIRKCSNDRNNVIHCHWAVHADYPDCLIRMRGLADPQLTTEAYDRRDFLVIRLRLTQAHRDLKEFSLKLPDARRRAEPKRSAWKVTGSREG